MIRLIVPNAKIIYCHRDPVDTCLSCYSRYFENGQKFSNDLGDLGRFYRFSRRLMAHWKTLFPGEILEIQYEEIVMDTEESVRNLLAFCELPWQQSCLEFYKTERPVRTASFAQVRQPIYRNALARWKNYEHHFTPLLEALDTPAAKASTSSSGGQ